MALKSICNGKNNSGIRVEGNLADTQIIVQISDDDNSSNEEHKASRPISTTCMTSLDNVVKNSTTPVFGSVSISNSDNVQFGNNTYFNGPVTIIQSKSGFENGAYSKTEEDNIQNEECNSKPKLETSAKKNEILKWHKLTFSALCVVVVGGIVAIVLLVRYKTEDNSSTTSPYGLANISANITVVGSSYDNISVILISTILLPIILFLMFSHYSLLTKMTSVIGERMIHYNTKMNKVAACDICMHDIDKEDPLLITPKHLRIVSRTDWLAQPVAGELDKLVHPIPWVIITHTATESCHTQSMCVLRVRLIQSFHIESRGWYDIGYNFLIGGDGSVYYGRGWDYMGAHTKGYNKYSIGIAFIGTFNTDSPSKQQVEACRKIIEQGVTNGKLVKDYKLFAHRQLMSTLSPGDKVFDVIKKWPHFVHNLTEISSLVPQDY